MLRNANQGFMIWKTGDDVGKMLGNRLSKQRRLAAPMKVAFVISH